MPLILAIDTETTGLLVKQDRVIEVGCVLYETESKSPLRIYDTLIRPFDPLPEGYVSPTGIKGEWLTAHGVSFPEAMGQVQRMVAAMPDPIILGHNVIGFDKPILEAELARHSIVDHGLMSAHVVDTRQDLPLEREPSSRRLIHMSAEFARFVNPFEHRALFDAMSCLKLLEEFEWDKVLELSKVPLITLRALTTYEQRDLAKELRYQWNGEDGKKFWYKSIRQNRFTEEQDAAAKKGFKITVL